MKWLAYAKRTSKRSGSRHDMHESSHEHRTDRGADQNLVAAQGEAHAIRGQGAAGKERTCDGPGTDPDSARRVASLPAPSARDKW